MPIFLSYIILNALIKQECFLRYENHKTRKWMSNSSNVLLINQIHTALLEQNITLIGSESCPKPVKLRAVL